MDALRATIASRKEKRKAEQAGATTAAPKGVDGGVKRFRTKKEIEEEQRLERPQQAAHSTPASTSSSLPSSPSPPSSDAPDERRQLSASARGRSFSPSPSPSSSAAASSPPPPNPTDVEPSSFEVRKRLRSHGQPVTLFGESATQRWQRLKAVELSRVEREGEGRGRNRFHEIVTSEVESDLKHVLLQEIERAKAPPTSSQLPTLPSATTDDTAAPAPHSSTHRHHSSYAHVSLSLSDFPTPHRFIVYFLKRMLSEWEAELEQRPADVRRSLQGKVDSATQKQTRESMRPLFTLLKAQQVDADILTHTLAIVQACMRGQWKEADESYLTMAIGNAPWPMGVTMVGIHERSGREKIYSDHVAHVLNDETARKYIQGIKRTITWCRAHYPQGWGGQQQQQSEGAGGAGAAQQGGGKDEAKAVARDGDEKG